MAAQNKCQWLSIGSTGQLGKSCMGAYCKEHKKLLQKNSGTSGTWYIYCKDGCNFEISSEHCGNSCFGAYCKVHLARLRKSPGTSETWRNHCKDGCNLEIKVDRLFVELNNITEISVYYIGHSGDLHYPRGPLKVYEAQSHDCKFCYRECYEELTNMKDPTTFIQGLSSHILPIESKINVALLSVLKLSSDDAHAVSWRLLKNSPDYNARNDYYSSLVDISEARCGDEDSEAAHRFSN